MRAADIEWRIHAEPHLELSQTSTMEFFYKNK